MTNDIHPTLQEEDEAEAAEGKAYVEVAGRSVTVIEPRAPMVVDVDAAIADWEAYQRLVNAILTPDDYQKIGGKSMKKKSAWRKLGRAFNISCQVVKEEIERDNEFYPTYARVVIRATAPNGTFQEADQECHVTEKCCEAAWTNPDDCTNKGRYHTHCPGGCNGKVHFSHPGDIIATATTRAKNRAISDIIGAGEVSAEELDAASPYQEPPVEAGGKSQDPPSAASQRRANPPKQTDDPATITEGQTAAIHDLVQKKFPGDEQRQVDFIAKTQQKAVNSSCTALALGGLSSDEAGQIIRALQRKETADPAADPKHAETSVTG